jgi:hypothetical protein
MEEKMDLVKCDICGKLMKEFYIHLQSMKKEVGSDGCVDNYKSMQICDSCAKKVRKIAK